MTTMDVTAATLEAARPVARDAAALNPNARAFLPWWRVGGSWNWKPLSAEAPEFFPAAVNAGGNATADLRLIHTPRRRAARTHRLNARGPGHRPRRPQRREAVNKTIFVTQIDHSVTEDMLAKLFGRCGTMVDCRSCGDSVSGLRSAFIEFQDEEEAYAALSFDGAIVGVCPLKVSRSRTAIIPINPTFLPQSEAEKEMCLRTVYCSNISKTVKEWNLKALFEGYFGEISRIKLLDVDRHATSIAFIEFAEIRGAIAALNSKDIYTGGIPIRVSPSKTPIRDH